MVKMSKKQRYRIELITFKKTPKQILQLHEKLLKKFGKHLGFTVVEIDKD